MFDSDSDHVGLQVAGFFGAPALGYVLERLTGSEALALGVAGLGWLLLGLYTISDSKKRDGASFVLGFIVAAAGVAVMIGGGYYLSEGE